MATSDTAMGSSQQLVNENQPTRPPTPALRPLVSFAALHGRMAGSGMCAVQPRALIDCARCSERRAGQQLAVGAVRTALRVGLSEWGAAFERF